MALDPPAKLTDMVHKAWTGAEAPFASVTNLAQTRDGALWVAGCGLYRFDGVRFTRFEPLSRSFVRNMIAARDGSLWVLLVTGRVSRISGATLTTFSLDDLPPTNALAEDRDGSILAATKYGLARFRDGHWGKATAGAGVPGKVYAGVWFDNDGALWLSAEGRYLRRLPGEDHFTDPAVPVRPRFLPYMVAPSQTGTVWFADVNSVHSLTPNGKETQVKVHANMVMVDRRGALWIGGEDEGVWRLPVPASLAGGTITPSSPELDHFTKKNGLSGNRVWCALEDREGNVWVGTDRGLDRFRDSAFHRVAIEDPERITELIEQADGGVLIRKRNPARIERIEPGGMITNLTVPGLTVNENTSDAICEDTAGVIWVATSTGVARLAGGRISYPPQLRLTSISRIGCGYGEVWIYDAKQGVIRFSAGKATRMPNLHWNVSRFLVEGPGRVWATNFDGRISVYDNGDLREYRAKDGAPEGVARSMLKSSNGDIWFASDGGLARFRNGRFQVAEITPGGYLYEVVSGENNTLWLLGFAGLTRIDIREFDRAVANPGYRPKVDGYGTPEGVPAPVDFMIKSGNRIWARTVAGLGYLSLDAYLSKSLLPPPVEIETVRADGKTMTASAGITLPKLTHGLSIEYTAFSLSFPEEVLFRYKLEGVDQTWQEAGTRRSAYYTDPKPRKYRFLVEACNNDGIWNETGAALDFSVAPAYYQTPWFEAVCLALLLMFLFGVYRYRLHQMAYQFNLRAEERVLERTRIARELHDTLLQSFQGLMLRLQVVDYLLPEGEAKVELEQTLERADQAIAEGRTAVFGLRSPTTTTNDLAEAVRALGEELARPSSAAFRLEVTGTPRGLHPIIRDEIYRIAREALRNAFHHAEAHHIETEIAYEERVLHLRMRDDGKGIPPAILEEGRRGHYGLCGMRERARQIGGKFSVWSRPGAGTEIELRIAGAIAYRTPPGRTRFRLFRRKRVAV